jgi:hypothetical protein
MRSGRTKLTRKARFILTHTDAGRVSKKTGLPASYLSRVRKGKVKTVDVKVERKLSRLYDNYWKNRLRDSGVREVEIEDYIFSDLPVKHLENIIEERVRIAELLVKNRLRRDKDLPKFSPSWHTVDEILKQMQTNESWKASEWQSYAKRTIVPALNKGKFYEAPEHKLWSTRRRRKR